ncbi:TRM11 family SAM-dependent methyltransferase [Patescibacteria group bacterium]
MKPNYFFIFGRLPTLSVGELVRVVRYGQWTKTRSAALLSGGSLEIEKLVQQLAGIVKAGNIIAVIDKKDFTDWLKSWPWSRMVKKSGKFLFGLSDYTDGILGDTKRQGLDIKKIFKSEGINSRLVTSREKQLSSVVVTKNKLISDGLELCLFSDGDLVYVGQTKAVQDFEFYNKKDYGRPQTQVKSGMLPPKLARIMIHLAEVRGNDSLVDPFCGVGTVLQEALDIGVAEVVGADMDEIAVAKAQKNLEWFRREIRPQAAQPKIIQSDVMKLSRRLLNRTFDRIVTEGYLGPPLSPRVTTARRKEIISELEGFYERIMPKLKGLLSPNGRMVLALPVIKLNNIWQQLKLDQLYDKTGLKTVPIIPADWAEFLNHDGDSVVYNRPQQQVGREIVILINK